MKDSDEQTPPVADQTETGKPTGKEARLSRREALKRMATLAVTAVGAAAVTGCAQRAADGYDYSSNAVLYPYSSAYGHKPYDK